MASTNRSIGKTFLTLCLKMLQFYTIFLLACSNCSLPIEARYVLSQNPRMDLSLKYSSAKSMDPRFSLESLP